MVVEGFINILFEMIMDWIGFIVIYNNWMFVVLIYIIWSVLLFKILVFIGGL